MLAAADFLERKRRALRRRRVATADALAALRESVRDLPPARSFLSAVVGGQRITVIAEYKRRSPSAGELCRDTPAGAARLYAASGARAVSVLTDRASFGARASDLPDVARACTLPTLRKDFIAAPEEVLRARKQGADAILLIVALLTAGELTTLVGEASGAGIDALVEVHDGNELERALAAGAQMIGINNRDLRTLTTTLATTASLTPLIPAGVAIVAESGIASADDVRRMRDAGAHAVLVGESLLRVPLAERAARVHELASIDR